MDQAEGADRAAVRTGVRTRAGAADKAGIAAARTRATRGQGSKASNLRAITASKSRTCATSQPLDSAASQPPGSSASQPRDSAVSNSRVRKKRKNRQASSDAEDRRRTGQVPAPSTSTAGDVRSPAVEKQQRAYELAMAEEEAKMEAAVAKQAEADSRKRRTKKRLKSMGQTARLHAAANETRADALRSEADGLHQRAAALERLEQRAQNRASGKAARKPKRASLSPDKNEVDHDNSEDGDDSSSYAGPSLSTISTEPTGRTVRHEVWYNMFAEHAGKTTTTATRAPNQVESARRDRREAQPASTAPVVIQVIQYNVFIDHGVLANMFALLNSQTVHGVDAFDCSEELWCDDAGAADTADESSEDDEQETVFEMPDGAGTPRVALGAEMDWSTPIDPADYDEFVNAEVAFQAIQTDGWELDPDKFPEDTNYSGLYEGEFGPTSSVMVESESPLGLFFYFMPRSLWRKISKESNRYCDQKLSDRAKRMFENQTADNPRTLQQIYELQAKKPRIEPHELLPCIGLLQQHIDEIGDDKATADNKSGPAAVTRNLKAVLPPQQDGVLYAVVTDRFYTSVQGAVQPLARGVYTLGTILANKTGYCTEIKEKNRSRPASIPRGTTRFAVNKAVPAVTAAVWWDNKPVQFLSTGGGREMVTCGGDKVTVPCPSMIRDYHRWMGGVDVHDQLRLQRYSLQLTVTFRKYYKTVFLGLVDMTLVNAFIVFREAQDQRGEKRTDHSMFFKLLQSQMLDLTAADFASDVHAHWRVGHAATNYCVVLQVPNQGTPTPVRHAPPVVPREHQLQECPEMEKIGEVVRHRQHQCKVCSVRKSKVGERVTTKWAYLCDRTRPHSKNGYTWYQVWHLEWANGANRPRPNVDRDIQMRATRVKSSRPRAPDDNAAGTEGVADEAQGSGDQIHQGGRPRTRRRLIAHDQCDGTSTQRNGGGEGLESAGGVDAVSDSQEPAAESTNTAASQPTSN
ncbi:unnamed protein product [Phytophthora fragariaefolia]|uniref:Unnamed protein product n=1 Tax=Phytophthora fragariaefolia TaxID=1490495 RepID=A0A9W7CSN5_9STRA|nr:unnamed protein product [Phytophthora fragariaefolia]